MSQPGFYFYTGDWIKDTRQLSIEVRGAWIDLLCALNEHNGSVTWPLRAFQQYWGLIDHDGLEYDAKDILDELVALGVCTVVTNPNGGITVTSRRMIREHKSKENNRIRQERHRAKQINNGPVTQKYSASSSSSSESNLKEITADAGFNVKNVDSKPLKTELNPRLKSVADRIYQSDIKKFARLIVWIKEAQREHFNDDDIITALMQFEPYAPAIEKWYPYLDKIIEKVQAVANAREAEAQSKIYKSELSEIYAETKKGKG
jgi:hypothetical protein